MRNNTFKHLLALVLTIAALAAGQSAWATGNFTVTNSGNTFTVTRTGNTSVTETVTYRLVSLSAIAGTHFTPITESLYFYKERNSINVTVTEHPDGSSEYYYQNGTTRKYRLEVLDKDGNVLASCDRDMSTGTNISSTAFNVKDVTIQTAEYSANDDGYDKNGYKSVSSSNYFDNAAPQSYLQSISAELRMTLSFQAKEEDDAYEYLQILINNTSTCDGRSGASNGDPGTPNLSIYMAGFEMNTGGTDGTYRNYTFPVTGAGNNASATNPWEHGTAWPLTMQRFNTLNPQLNYCATDGRLVLPVNNFNSLVLRLNASGSSGSDKWWAKNVVAHIQAVDATAPTVLDNYRVSGGRHQKENTFYVSVPFSEIVTVSGTPTLSTSWGTLTYVAGSGSNVLTFNGIISNDATGTLSVTGYSGTIRDLAGNAFSGTISKDFDTALDADYAWSLADFNSMGSNTYEISTKHDLRHLALMVNGNYDLGSKKTFSQTHDIVCDDTYIPIGVYSSLVASVQSRPFFGTYDGQGYTISGITIHRTGYVDADNIGLFGYIGSGSTVQNVVLAGSTFKGRNNVGGIAGYNKGTISNCRVESSVSIMAGTLGASNYGGIAGTSYSATIIGCVSAAVVSNNGYNNCIYYGGIVGIQEDYSALSNCLYTGTTVIGNSKTGPIVGETSMSNLTNNYYTDSSFGDGMYGARRARTVSLGDGITISGAETTYDVSGLTAIGTAALRTSAGTIYSGKGQTLTLGYSGAVPEGYTLSYTVTRTSNGSDITTDVLSGTTLTMPAYDVTVTVAVSANPSLDVTASSATLFDETKYVTTFYHGTLDYQLPEGAKAYTASLDGEKVVFHLVGEDGSVIPSGTAVIIVADAASVTLTTLASTEVTAYAGNILQGSDTAVTVSGLSGTPYVLNISGGTLGFYKFTGASIPAGKAYYLKSE